jgi:hypothetical protein
MDERDPHQPPGGPPGDTDLFLPLPPAGAPRDNVTAEDQEVAKGYFDWEDKGPIHDGMRLTVMSRSTTYGVGDEVRVIHALEVVAPGRAVYIMGPKPVVGTYLDDRLASPPPPDVEDPWIPLDYDGATTTSPAIDCNYEVSVFRFDEPGEHRIEWRLPPLRSNGISIRVTPSGGEPRP